MMNWWNDGAGTYSHGWGFGMALMMLVWVPLIALGVWLVGRVMRPAPPRDGHHAPTVESARAILDRRFATGELDAEQYAQMRRTLE